MATNNLQTDLWEFDIPSRAVNNLQTDLWEFDIPTKPSCILETDEWRFVDDLGQRVWMY